ncbi:MAG: glycosyltransferase family 2 protein, partial [Candidatus Omnitrophica bacterium]|nr:glycosyltransferase family 2 protein [Candidatus Omnitrophota bacterium]
VSSALVTCARDEGPYLLEWACYHHLLGFDRIYIYSHDNNDGSEELLWKMQEAGLITYVDMTGRIPANEGVQQFVFDLAFHSIKEGNEADWMCVIDLDEFIVLKKHSSIYGFLSRYSVDTDGIVLNWQMFNANSQILRADGLVVDRFMSVGRTNRRAVKTIAKVRSLTGWENPHIPKYNKTEHLKVIYADGTLLRGEPSGLHDYYTSEEAVLNHYVTKSYEEFLVKIDRCGGMVRYEDRFNPNKKRVYIFPMQNSCLGKKQLDEAIRHTFAYRRLKSYLKEVLSKHDLQEAQDKVLRQHEELSQRLLRQVPDKEIQDIKQMLAL